MAATQRTANLHGDTIEPGMTIEGMGGREYSVEYVASTGDVIHVERDDGEERQIVCEGGKWYICTREIDAEYAGRATRVVEEAERRVAGHPLDMEVPVTLAEGAIKDAQEIMGVALPRCAERIAIEELAERIDEQR